MSVLLYPCIYCVAMSMDMFVLCVTCLLFGCACYFVVECDGGVKCGWRYSIG